jgi:MFS family permease
VLFAETGLSVAEISSLFAIWSVTGFVLEVPSGAWADAYSRRRLLVLAPALAGAGFALWTFFPSYLSFAAGFVLWGVGGALQSGTEEALVYEELARVGASGAYARLIGRAEAASTLAQLIATLLAAPVLAIGGAADYRVLGVASVAATLLAAVVGWSLPESRGRGRERQRYVDVLRGGLAEVRRNRPVRHSLLLVATLTGVTALDEYTPLLAQATGVAPATVPLLVALITTGFVVGGWLAGRGMRWTAPVLAVGAGCLAAGALPRHPAGLVLVAAAYGVFQWAIAAADARLQEQITDQARATVTSVAGLGSELIALGAAAGYGLGSTWAGPGPLFAIAAVPYLLIALALRRSPASGRDHAVD